MKNREFQTRELKQQHGSQHASCLEAGYPPLRILFIVSVVEVG